jgi:hypothetical protein
MNVIHLHSVVVPPMHNGNFGPDEFICMGLVAIALVVATFFIRGGEKSDSDDAPATDAERPAERPVDH